MRYSVDKIFLFASMFEKRAQETSTQSVSLSDYAEKGLLDPSIFRGKRAKPGFSITGKPYPTNYSGGFNPDGSGLPTGFDDDLTIDAGMNKEQIQSWVLFYMGETDPTILSRASASFAKFPLAAKILADKAAFIQNNIKQ
jgi:hypothetical protein